MYNKSIIFIWRGSTATANWIDEFEFLKRDGARLCKHSWPEEVKIGNREPRMVLKKHLFHSCVTTKIKLLLIQVQVGACSMFQN